LRQLFLSPSLQQQETYRFSWRFDLLINLQWKIRALGFKNYQVASAANVSESKFSRALSGRSELSLSEQSRIATALGVSDHAWLFKKFAVIPRSYNCAEPSAPITVESVAQ
jgi:hypothetical protein